MNPMFSTLFLIMIMVIAVGIVVSVGIPAVNTAKETASLKEAESTMKMLDNHIKEVRAEGSGSERRVKLNSPGEFTVSADEDALQFKMVSSVELFEFFSRRIAGSLMYISGSDVKCSTGNNLTLENTFVKASFQRIAQATPLSATDTKNNILSMEVKTTGTIVNFANTTVLVDSASGNGTGYSELLPREGGTSMPSCSVHFFINSTNDYDIYYTLYAGADFLVADVRNVI